MFCKLFIKAQGIKWLRRLLRISGKFPESPIAFLQLSDVADATDHAALEHYDSIAAFNRA